MKKLNNKQWREWLKEIHDMAEEKHEDYNVQIILSEMYYTLAESNLWEIPKMIWRERQLNQVIKKHKNCCDLNN